MANNATTPYRLGQSSATGDARALFLKVFSGEVMRTFDTKTVMMSRHIVRTVESGKTVQFPIIGRAGAKYHVVGENIFDSGAGYLTSIGIAARDVNIDQTLISPAFISNWDEFVNHYDVRAPFSQSIGEALARNVDKRLMRQLVLAARADETIDQTTAANQPTNPLLYGASAQNTTGDTAGATLTTDNLATGYGSGSPTYAALIAALRKSAAILDTKDVPEEDRYALLTPAQYYTLLENSGSGTDIISRDFNGDNGSMASGKVYMAFGIELVKTNQMPTDNYDGTAQTNDVGTPGGGTYTGDFRKTCGIVFHKSAIATAKLRDLVIESEYDMDRQGNKLLARMVHGHGILRPECCVEWNTSTNNA